MPTTSPPGRTRNVAGMAAGAREWDSEPMRALVERLLPDARGRE